MLLLDCRVGNKVSRILSVVICDLDCLLIFVVLSVRKSPIIDDIIYANELKKNFFSRPTTT